VHNFLFLFLANLDLKILGLNEILTKMFGPRLYQIRSCHHGNQPSVVTSVGNSVTAIAVRILYRKADFS